MIGDSEEQGWKTGYKEFWVRGMWMDFSEWVQIINTFVSNVKVKKKDNRGESLLWSGQTETLRMCYFLFSSWLKSPRREK